jgi:hypothetical protein
MPQSSTRKSERSEALSRVREWTRGRFDLPDEAPILVSERLCALPGFPPRETHVLFLTGGGKRHHFKVFKPVLEVVPEDLPYPWLKDTLLVAEGAGGCDCC